MKEIPLYLKTAPDMPRPADPEFYWLTRDGLFLCRNHAFFETDVPAPRPPRVLARHEPFCRLHYPRLTQARIEEVVGFFDRVYRMHGSEAIALLVWDRQQQGLTAVIPEQEATVWESSQGRRSPLDVRYQVPVLPPGHLLVGDIHCHGDLGAYASSTDHDDEEHRDGIHVVVGHIDREPPSFHVELAVDCHRFAVEPNQVFEGYSQRTAAIPPDWLERVKIKVKRPFGPGPRRYRFPGQWHWTL
jgi:hypothetical protein